MTKEHLLSIIKKMQEELRSKKNGKWLPHYISRRLPIFNLLFFICFAYGITSDYILRSFENKAIQYGIANDFSIFSSPFVLFFVLILLFPIFSLIVDWKKKQILFAWIGMMLVTLFPFFLYQGESMALLIGAFHTGTLIVIPMLINRILGFTRSYERTNYLLECANILHEQVDVEYLSVNGNAEKAYYELREKRHLLKFTNTVEDTFYVLDQANKKLGG